MDPVENCCGIGPKRAILLKKMGVSKIADALLAFPVKCYNR
jgi:hypothetical protein